MKKTMIINVILIIVICSLVSYIIGSQTVHADVTDGIQLAAILQEMKNLYDQAKTINNMFQSSNNNLLIQLKVFAATTGNQKLLDQINRFPDDILTMNSGDFVHLSQNRVEDVLTGLIGKITIKFKSGLNDEETTQIQQTRNLFAGTNYGDTGAKTEGQRIGMLSGLLDNIFDDMQVKYGVNYVYKGTIIDQNLDKSQGSMPDFINYQQTFIKNMEIALNSSKDASLSVHEQIIERLLVQSIQISIKQLEAQIDNNRMMTFQLGQDGYRKLYEDSSGLTYQKN